MSLRRTIVSVIILIVIVGSVALVLTKADMAQQQPASDEAQRPPPPGDQRATVQPKPSSPVAASSSHQGVPALGLSADSLSDLPDAPPPAQHTAWIAHHVVIQIDQSDAQSMNLALNNATNLQDYWDKKGEKGQIEFVAFGPGLAMVRSDQSPVQDRIMTLTKRGMVFSGCHNTKEKQSTAEGKPVTLLSGVIEVSTGVARIVELEEQGYTYLRP